MQTPIIIVSYRTPFDMAQCIAALDHNVAQPFEVYVCENGGAAAWDPYAMR